MKSVSTAYIEHTNWRKQLLNFLLTSRNAPHCATNLSPASVMFWRKTSFTISSINATLGNYNQRLRETQEKAKIKHKEYFHQQNNSVEHNINVRDTVIIKQLKQNKLSPTYEPTQYHVTAKNHNMTTATDSTGQHTKTRNVSHFHSIPPIKFEPQIDTDNEADITKELPAQTQTFRRRYPVRNWKLIVRYDGQYL